MWKTRSLFRVGPGEEARLTPEGPTAAVVSSRGFLPFRVRAQARGVHHRPEFPGSTLVLGDADFEVVEEVVVEDAVLYRLEPWPKDHIVRERIVYGPALVRAAQEERRRLEERERARRYAVFLSPLVGFLSEDEQIRQCDRFGLEPAQATLSSGVLEIVLIFAAYRLAYGGLGPAGAMGLIPVFVPFLFVAVARVLFAVLFGEVAGSLWFGLGGLVRRAFRSQRERFDASVLPLTRETFWARLSLPDRQQQEPDGSLSVTSTLPHLSWKHEKRLSAGGDWWMVTSLPPSKLRGRLLYAYVLTPLVEPEDQRPSPTPPGPTHYQDEVWAAVEREWEAFLGSFSWVVCLLPARVQQRALGRRGGPQAIRRASLATATLSLVAAVWFGLGFDPLSLATALLLGADGAVRLWRLVQGRYAPSLLGGLFADFLRPERLAYHGHRDAEREALAALEERAG
jgi:hypothetical protein